MRRRYAPLILGVCAGLSMMSLGGNAYAAQSATPSPESTVLGQMSQSDKTAFLSLDASKRHEVALALTDPRITGFALTDAQAKAIYPDISLITDSGSAIVPAASKPSVSSTALVAAASVVQWHSYYNHSATFFGKSYNTAHLNFYYGVSGSSVVSANSCVWSDTGFSTLNIDNVTATGWASGGLGYCYATVQLSTVPYPVLHSTLSQNMRVNSTKIIFTYFHQT